MGSLKIEVLHNAMERTMDALREVSAGNATLTVMDYLTRPLINHGMTVKLENSEIDLYDHEELFRELEALPIWVENTIGRRARVIKVVDTGHDLFLRIVFPDGSTHEEVINLIPEEGDPETDWAAIFGSIVGEQECQQRDELLDRVQQLETELTQAIRMLNMLSDGAGGRLPKITTQDVAKRLIDAKSSLNTLRGDLAKAL